MSNLSESVVLLEDVLNERARWKEEGVTPAQADSYNTVANYRYSKNNPSRTSGMSEEKKKQLEQSKKRAQFFDRETMRMDKNVRDDKNKNAKPKSGSHIGRKISDAYTTAKIYSDKAADRAANAAKDAAGKVASRAKGAAEVAQGTAIMAKEGIAKGVGKGKKASAGLLRKLADKISSNEAITELGLYLKDISTLYECGRSEENDELCAQILDEAALMIQSVFGLDDDE